MHLSPTSKLGYLSFNIRKNVPQQNLGCFIYTINTHDKWNPSCKYHPFDLEKWPFKWGGLSSGVEINTFMFLYCQVPQEGWPLKGVPLYTSWATKKCMRTVRKMCGIVCILKHTRTALFSVSKNVSLDMCMLTHTKSQCK